jgi:hypothetical protein
LLLFNFVSFRFVLKCCSHSSRSLLSSHVLAKDGGTIGLYVHLKVKDAGLGQSFYVPLAFELLVKNHRTGQYVRYASPEWRRNGCGYWLSFWN